MTTVSAELPATPDVVAPDGSDIGLLAVGTRGSMVRATLPSDAVTRAVRHRTVEELWYVEGGSGQIWIGGEVVLLRRGVSVVIPTGTPFQFRSGYAGLGVVTTTMPPWPGDEEGEPAAGPWTPTV
jgi:mannose-6-phosphate isomerase-like protein (cupin superfamily)